MSETPPEDTTVAELQETPGPGPENPEETQPQQSRQKTWYPYITKTQFEKFLSRLQSNIPKQIDRDYIRAIIRTPSMIYRFLRGIESMKLINRDQKPTERLQLLVAPESRQQTIVTILKDLYPDLLERWQQTDGAMPDSDVVDFFQQRTGMGRDSANKMKMFFKFLLGEAALSKKEDALDKGEDELSKGEESPPAATSEPEPEKPAPVAPAQDRKPEPEKSAPVAPAQDRKPEPEKPTPVAPAQDRKPEPEKSAPVAPAQRRRPEPEKPAPAQPPSPSPALEAKELSEWQKAYLDTLQKVVKINIDGDWDDDMIRLTFERLERLVDRIKRG